MNKSWTGYIQKSSENIKKFRENLGASLPAESVGRITEVFLDRKGLEAMSVPDFMELFTV